MAETGSCTIGSSGYTGPVCLPSDPTAEDHAACIEKIDTADISEIPEIPDNVIVPVAPTVKDITTEVIGGTGAFDVFMRAGANQLQEQYLQGRIKGAEYASAYIEMMKLMMEQAAAFTVKKFETEMAGALFQGQYMKTMYDAITAEHAANKMIADAYLTSVQACELPLNGSADRILKGEQSKAQAKTVDLYDRQITGFDDKDKNDVFKTVMDSWAVQGVEIVEDPTESVSNTLLAESITKVLQDTLDKAGIDRV